MYFLKTSPAIDYKNHRTSKDKAWEDGTGEMRCVFPSKGNTRFRGGNGRAFGETVNRLVSFDQVCQKGIWNMERSYVASVLV